MVEKSGHDWTCHDTVCMSHTMLAFWVCRVGIMAPFKDSRRRFGAQNTRLTGRCRWYICFPSEGAWATNCLRKSIDIYISDVISLGLYSRSRQAEFTVEVAVRSQHPKTNHVGGLKSFCIFEISRHPPDSGFLPGCQLTWWLRKQLTRYHSRRNGTTE